MFITQAIAQTTTGAPATDTGSGLLGMLPIALMFVVLWFFMIRPQMKKAKEHQNLVAGIQSGDEVITQGGIAGRVTKVGDNFFTIAIAEVKDVPIEIKVQKQAVGALLPKDTLKGV